MGKWLGKTIKDLKRIEESISIIGAGPFRHTCPENEKVWIQSYSIRRYDRPGGLLIYGISTDEKFVVERRAKLLKSGIKFVQNFEVGKDKTLEELKSDHDAILIATECIKLEK